MARKKREPLIETEVSNLLEESLGNAFDLGAGWAEDHLTADMLDAFNLGDKEEEVIDNDHQEDTRYIRPKLRSFSRKMVKFKYAQEAAQQMYVGKNERAMAIVAGNFIFGDFIEAYLTEHMIRAEKMYIATLSMNRDNLVSLQALMKNDYIGNLDILLSAYFYAHERWKFIPEMYEHLDMDNRFQMSVIGHHMKVCIFETHDGNHIVISGSANLRSAATLEQFTIEENEELYHFYEDAFLGMIDEYKTIQLDVKKPDGTIDTHISRRKAIRMDKAYNATVRGGGK